MWKMVHFFYLFFLCFLGLQQSGASQDFVELVNIYETTPERLQTTSSGPALGLPFAVSVTIDKVTEISGSVLAAETWLRTQVLSHYPASKITTIVAGVAHPCRNQNLAVILTSLKNIYYSLTRWGLEKDIKVSPAFSSMCLEKEEYMTEVSSKALFEFLHSVNSTYSIILSSEFFPNSHLESMKKFGLFTLKKVNVLTRFPKQTKPMSRKLADINFESRIINPYPARPTPLPQISPLHSSVGFSVPADVAKSPQPPLSSHSSSSPPPFSLPSDSPPPFSFQSDAPSPTTFSIPPETPPAFGVPMPPCNPVDDTAGAPSPVSFGPLQKLWCVAKPNVLAETLQEAIDYACGEGGAECDEITPGGNCYNPDTVVAHASYAFNSYWQKTKRSGGTCTFGGTAMLINSDPSFRECRFELS